MPRKESITRNDILKAAFNLAREEGVAEVTARRLASKAGCSTQPIFRLFKNMEEVLSEVMAEAISFFDAFYEAYPKSQATPFVNLGLAYISFAEKEKNLFQMMFLNDKRGETSLYELLNGKNGNVLTEINHAKDDGCKDPHGMFMKIWIFIHGMACMTITGDYDLGITETIEFLKDAYQSFA